MSFKLRQPVEVGEMRDIIIMMNWLINAALVNAWILYQKTTKKKKLSHFHFRLKCAHSFINDFTRRRKAAASRPKLDKALFQFSVLSIL